MDRQVCFAVSRRPVLKARGMRQVAGGCPATLLKLVCRAVETYNDRERERTFDERSETQSHFRAWLGRTGI
jgi:hypothetical protein